MLWRIIYYENSQGNSPVQDFIDSLDPRAKSKIINTLDLLAKFGVNLGLPHSKKLTGTKIWELRVLGSNNIRLLYVAIINKSFLLLHGFLKKKQKTDIKEIKIAEKRLAHHLSRKSNT